MPGHAVTAPLEADFHVLYPEAPFLQDPELVTAYTLARSNREQINRAPKVYEHYQLVSQHLDDFARAKKPITHPEKEDVAWLAQQIPQDNSYLLLGESHGEIGIMVKITALVNQLHLLEPERPCIVLTEFLTDMTIWNPSTPLIGFQEGFRFMFQQFSEMGIPVIGLEPRFVKSNARFNVVGPSFIDRNGQKIIYQNSFWGTGEGVRLRNAHYIKRINQIHQKFPNARIIVYTGGAHLEYSQPYSVGDALAGPTTKVISFRPTTFAPDLNKPQEFVPYISTFDNMTNQQFINDRILSFDDPELTHLFGADIVVKSPF